MLTALIASAMLASPIPAIQPVPAQPAPAQPAPSPPAPVPAATPEARPDPWWIERNDSFNARAKQGRDNADISIIFLGDSITEGWLTVGKEVWDLAYAPRGAVDFGISGDRTQHLLYRVQNGNLDGLAAPAPRAGGKPPAPPALAVILIGTNNTDTDSAADIAAGITAIVGAVREKLPDTKVLLLGIFPRADPANPARAKIKEVNAAIAKLADNAHTYFLDIGDKFLNPSGLLPADIMPDQLHLTTKGYQVWADAMGPKVQDLLGKSGR